MQDVPDLYTRTIWKCEPTGGLGTCGDLRLAEFVARTELLYFPNNLRAFFSHIGTDVCHRIYVSRHILPHIHAFLVNTKVTVWYTALNALKHLPFHTYYLRFSLLSSIILHEIAHGYAAYIQGDETANRGSGLTLNPLPHIDPVGSVIVPFLAFSVAGTFFDGQSLLRITFTMPWAF